MAFGIQTHRHNKHCRIMLRSLCPIDDASNLVRGDVIKLDSGDRVPADCVLLSSDDTETELLVDVRDVTGEATPREIPVDDGRVPPAVLYYGGLVLQGAAMAVVTATGPNTLLATLIREKRFPPKDQILISEDEVAGVSLSSDKYPEMV